VHVTFGERQMTLPPLANVFALRDPDPARRAQVESFMTTSARFDVVWTPAPGWIAGRATVNGSGAESGRDDLVFVEGQDVILKGDHRRTFDDVVTMVDETPRSVYRLPGDFGFARFRPDGSASVVRSCAGVVPFYTWSNGERAAISSRFDDLVTFLPAVVKLDTLVLAAWTTGSCFFPDGRTFVSGVSIVSRGHIATIRPRGSRISTERFWDPRPAERPVRPGDFDDRARRLRSILVDQLRSDLDPDGINLLALSGGVDSSSLAWLTTRTTSAPVATLSYVSPDPAIRQRELEFIRPITQLPNVVASYLRELQPETPLRLALDGPTVAFPIASLYLNSLPAIRQETEITVTYSGFFADELCGSSLTFVDWVNETPARMLASRRIRAPFGRRDYLRWFKWRALELARRPFLPYRRHPACFIRHDVKAQYQQWLRDVRTRVAADNRPWRSLALRIESDGLLAMAWEVASALRIRCAFPFFNRELIELTLQCHPSELIGPGTKRLLRRALIDDVPHLHLLRPDKGRWGVDRQRPFSWTEAIPQSLADVLDDDCFPLPGAFTVGEGQHLAFLVRFAAVVEDRQRMARTTGLVVR
jgi:asparagine synthetase B (glutamine-hydrolysing)